MLGLNLGIGLPIAGVAGGGGVSVPFGSAFVAAGDSITDNGNALSGTLSNLIGRGYWAWAMVLAAGRIAPVYQVDAGVSGNNTTQLLARYATDVTAKSPKVVLLLIGTNDVSASVSAATILANIDSMIAANRAIGAVTIVGRILPRGSVGSPMSGGLIAIWEAVNAGISARAASDILVWDAEPVIGAMDAQHTILAGHTTAEDLLHPNTLCAQKIGAVVAPLIAGLIPSGDGMFLTDNAAGNYLTNGFLAGTGGSNAGGSTGQVATGWAGTASNIGGAALAFSKISRGALGEWQQHAISGTYTGNNRASFCSRTIASVSPAIPTGSRVMIEGEVEVDTLTSVSSVSIACTMNSGAISCEAFAAYAGETAGPAGTWTGVLRSAPLLLGSDVTQLQFFQKVTLLETAGTPACAATVRFGRLGLKVVS